MFLEFFYTLKEKGLDVSMTEWLTLMDALDKGLIRSNFSNFYYISRMILVKSESDYDKFDMAFMEFFQNVHYEDELPEALKQWLDKGDGMTVDEQNQFYAFQQDKDAATVKRMFRERIAEQKTEHNGGNQWIGTAGGSAFGHHGRNVGGIRVGAMSGMQSAFQVLGDRKFEDFRNDKVLNTRQYQVAFRRLRQYSSRMDVPKTELDIDGTIQKTCNNGGYLQLEFERPRKNTVKLLLLFDCGGTMIPFMNLCNELFQAVKKANHFKDVKTFYFHNCIYSKLYKNPECETGDWISLEDVFKKYDKDYKVIIVGDAQMAPEELFEKNGNYRGPNDGLSGYEWCELLLKKYKKVVWMNPRYHKSQTENHWMESENALSVLFHMYTLSVDGLKDAITYLMKSK
mgnify:FL=1